MTKDVYAYCIGDCKRKMLLLNDNHCSECETDLTNEKTYSKEEYKPITKEQLKVLLKLCCVTDNTGVLEKDECQTLIDFTDEQAKNLGYETYVDALHDKDL